MRWKVCTHIIAILFFILFFPLFSVLCGLLLALFRLRRLWGTIHSVGYRSLGFKGSD